MQQIISYLTSLEGQTPNLTKFGIGGVIVTMVIALLYCFFGYKFLRAFVTIIGFIIGMGIGYLVSHAVGANTVVMWILVILFAVALAAVSFFLYRAGIFIVTFFVVLGVVFKLVSALPAPWPPVLALIAAIIAAILAVIFVRPVAIITSGLCGGLSFSAALINDLVKWQSDYSTAVVLIFGLALAVLGMVFQFRTTKAKGKK